MLMASTFLPIVFNNLPPYLGSHHLWTILWILSLLIFSPKVLLNRQIAYLILYGLLLLIALETIWATMDQWNRTTLIKEFYQIFIGFSVFIYFSHHKDYINLARIAKWSIIFLTITAIMSIVSSIIDPMYARNLTGLLDISSEKERAIVLSYQKYGGGNYSTAGAFMSLFPLLVYYYKNNSFSLYSKKTIFLLSIIFFLALIGIKIFGNILIAILFGILALSGMKKMRYTIMIISSVIFLAIIIPKETYGKILHETSEHFEKKSILNSKISDLAYFIENEQNIESNSGVSGRLARYPMLVKSFEKSPIFGCYLVQDSLYKPAGAHLYWMNRLTIFGIVGFLIFMNIPLSFIKTNLKDFTSTYKFYYILASLAIISYGLMKAIAGRETWYTFFIILPGLYYLPLLHKSRTIIEE